MTERLPVYLRGFDFTSTVRDYEFTKKAERGILRVIESDDFQDMDAMAAYLYLRNQMELVSFSDYLRRYIYERAEIEKPFRQVTDAEYAEIIKDSFKQTNTPRSFEKTTRKWSAIVNGWLARDGAERKTVFLLGFGLSMTEEDVSSFLTKVIRDEDYNFSSPEEAAYWYCFHNHLPYSAAYTILHAPAEDMPATGSRVRTAEEAVAAGLDKIENITRYVTWLRAGIAPNVQSVARRYLEDLLAKTRILIAEMYQKDEEEIKSGKIWNPSNISNGDIEAVICSGIPVTKGGNLQKASKAVLSRHFHQYRLSRQRLSAVLTGISPVNRFDLITLLFFIYSQKTDMNPDDRCKAFLDKANAMLTACSMMKVHPVNPYETYVLLCLLADEPLAEYSDIWEMAYEGAEENV